MRVVPAVRGVRRSDVAWFGDTRDLVVHRVDRDARPDPVILASWLREQALAAIDEAIRPHAAALGVTPTSVAVRDPRTRWGSASRGGRLSFSWRLILAPPFVLDYVAAHEVAHLVHMNHSPHFWKAVEKALPEMNRGKAWLKAHGKVLMGYGLE